MIRVHTRLGGERSRVVVNNAPEHATGDDELLRAREKGADISGWDTIRLTRRQIRGSNSQANLHSTGPRV
jgi:hypothetical protein